MSLDTICMIENEIAVHLLTPKKRLETWCIQLRNYEKIMQSLRETINLNTVLYSGQIRNNCYKNTACKNK